MVDDDLDHRISEARAYAREVVDTWPGTETLEHWGPIAQEAYFKSKLGWVPGPRSSYMSGNLENLGNLCELAETDAGCRAAASEIAAERVLNDQPLTEDFSRFVYRHLMGELPKIKSKPGRKENFMQDWFLIAHLRIINERFGLRPTHNDERDASWKLAGTETSPPSGAAILAERFQAIGQHDVTARAIMEVWKNKEKQSRTQRLEALVNSPR